MSNQRRANQPELKVVEIIVEGSLMLDVITRLISNSKLIVSNRVTNQNNYSNQVSTHNLNRILGAHVNEDHLNGVSCRIPELPKIARSCLFVLFQAQENEAAIGDFIERYGRKYQELGRRRADSWLYLEIFRSFLPLLFRIAGKLGWLILGEWIKKHTF